MLLSLNGAKLRDGFRNRNKKCAPHEYFVINKMGRSLPSNSHLTESIISTVADETDWHDLVRNQSTVACDGNATAANCSLQPSVPTKIAGVQLQYHLLFLLIFPVITVFGNVLVSMSVYRERSLQTVTNYFIVSLAISDIMVAVLVMPFAVYVEVSHFSQL